MVYDFRAPKDSEAYRNAATTWGADCYVDGVKLDRVCYIDTEAGVVHVYAVRQWADGRIGPYFYGHRWRGYFHTDDGLVSIAGALNGLGFLLPEGVAYYEAVEPTIGEPLRLRRYGRVEIRHKAQASA